MGVGIVEVQAQAPQTSVLVVYAARRDGTGPAISDAIFQRIIGDGLGGHLDYHSEHLDLARFSEPGYQDAAWKFLVAKHRGKDFALLIAFGDPTVDFLTRLRDHLAPGKPLIFTTTQSRAAPPNASGLIAPQSMKATLESALELQPDINNVVVVGGASTLDRTYERLARSEFAAFDQRIRFTYLNGLPMAEILASVARLPPHSLVFFSSFVEDAAGQRFLPLPALDRLTATANAPVYGWRTSHMGHGVVGGQLLSTELLTERLADVALRVLRGERARTIPVRQVDWSVRQYDWQQLRRWGIATPPLTAESDILFRQPNAWEQYWFYIVGGTVLVLLQTSFIAALLVQGRRRRRAEAALRESEERFRLMADTAPVLVWRVDVGKLCDFVNRPWLEFTGRTLEQELGEGWVAGVHPDDEERCLSIFRSSFDARRHFHVEFRVRRADGEYRWLFSTGVPRYGPDGSFAGYIGSCLDITDRRQAEDNLAESERQLQRLAGRLIAAQEADRARIARDLHDDINQQIAGLSLALSAAKRRAAAETGPRLLADDLSILQDRAAALAADIRRLSHNLHPSGLEHSGLVAALAMHCGQQQDQSDLALMFSSEGDFEHIEPSAALCLFRVAQEALRNVVVHAAARQVTVHLARHGDAGELTVADDGCGFDFTEVRARGEGLGLVSIHERARLAGGVVSLRTEAGQGTTLRVRVPIAARIEADALHASLT